MKTRGFVCMVSSVALAGIMACFGSGCAPAMQRFHAKGEQTVLDPAFFQHCAFVCVDFQAGERGPAVTEETVPALWKKMGFTAEDVNAAVDFGWDVAYPNAVKVTEACRRMGLKMIFIHWGYLFEDGMDLDPDIYRSMKEEHGNDYSKWSGYIGQPGSQPAKWLNIQPGEYVIPKSAQDAFTSSNINFVLQNLGIKHIVFIGGHTGACLGKTSKSAKKQGYKILCVEDATVDARESARLKHIEDVGYDYVLTTAEFLKNAEEFYVRQDAKTQK